MLYPLRFEPLYFEKVWGGRRLETILGRQLPPEMPIGESWEISDHPHGMSVVANGPEKGKTLRELIERNPLDLLGSRVSQGSNSTFPLLVKYIDADDKLSVQVHPDDDYAEAHEGELGKTEMWYILHAEPGAELIAGLNEGVTKEQFLQSLAKGNPSILLSHLPAHTGDSIFIPAGRIHAILPGLVILEIQQNSDTTYRLYDWGRPGLDGTPRKLHIEQAADVANWQDHHVRSDNIQVINEGLNTKSILASCRYFVVEKYDLTLERRFTTDGGSFYIINCVNGNGSLLWQDGCEQLEFAQSFLIPAELAGFTLQPNGKASFILSYVP